MGSDIFNNKESMVYNSKIRTSGEKCERLSLGKRPLFRFVAVSRAAASRKFNPII